MFTIYHNPRCRKSRETLQLLEKNNISPQIIHYLEDTPSKSELKSLLKKLNIKAEDLIRKSETEYKEIYKGKQLSDEDWLEAMILYPKLIERPIVVKGDKAVIGRPPENVLILL